MKSLLVLSIFGILSVTAMAQENSDHPKKKMFECKLKVFPKVKKMGIKFKAADLKDEEDILKLRKYHTVVINNVEYSIAGGLSKDDECKNKAACRMVVYLRVANSTPAVGYANNATKTGAMNNEAKLSCTVRDCTESEEHIEDAVQF